MHEDFFAVPESCEKFKNAIIIPYSVIGKDILPCHLKCYTLNKKITEDTSPYFFKGTFYEKLTPFIFL